MLRNIWRWIPRRTASAVIGVCLLLTTGCSGNTPKEEPTPTPVPPLAVSANSTYTVQKGEIIKELNAKGRIVPVAEQRLFFRSSGYVRTVYVRQGDLVESGQVLADLEIGDLENQLAQADINLKSSEAELTSAKQSISDALVEAQIALTIEQLRLEEAKYYLARDDRLPQQIAVKIQEEQVKLAELRVERLQRGPDTRLVQAVDLARLTIDRLKAQIADSSITAPGDGQVLGLNIKKGDEVTAFKQTVMSVFDPAQLEVGVELTAEELKLLFEEMKVNIKPSKQPAGKTGVKWEGVIRRLPFPYGKGSSSTADNSDTSVRITIQTSAQEAGYELGDMVDVQVVLEDKTDVLWLPPQVIRTFEGRKFVVLQENDHQRRVDVKLGIESPDRVEIVEGLEEGQIVVSP